LLAFSHSDSNAGNPISRLRIFLRDASALEEVFRLEQLFQAQIQLAELRASIAPLRASSTMELTVGKSASETGFPSGMLQALDSALI